MTIKVVSRAMMDIFPTVEQYVVLNHSSPFFRIISFREIAPEATGKAMKTRTLTAIRSHGTGMLLTPKYSAAIGAYRKSIRRALIAVFISPCAMSPFARNIHHMTIAVHGDKPSRMIPAFCSGSVNIRLAKSVINGGAIIQFAIIVVSRGLGRVAAFFMSLNRIPRTVGYIMKNSRMPIGIDSLLYLREFMSSPNWGRNFPTSKPIIMQMAIQSVRYFSKIPRFASFFVCVDVNFLPSSLNV